MSGIAPPCFSAAVRSLSPSDLSSSDVKQGRTPGRGHRRNPVRTFQHHVNQAQLQMIRLGTRSGSCPLGSFFHLGGRRRFMGKDPPDLRLQDILINVQLLRHLLDEQVPLDGVPDPAKEGNGLPELVPVLLQRPPSTEDLFDVVIDHRQGLGYQLLHLFAPPRADVIVRVMAVGEDDRLCMDIPCQKQLQASRERLPTRLVRIEYSGHAGCVTPEQIDLGPGQGGPQRGHNMLNACAPEGDQVENSPRPSVKNRPAGSPPASGKARRGCFPSCKPVTRGNSCILVRRRR